MYVDIFNTDQRYDLIVTDPPTKSSSDWQDELLGGE